MMKKLLLSTVIMGMLSVTGCANPNNSYPFEKHSTLQPRMEIKKYKLINQKEESKKEGGVERVYMMIDDHCKVTTKRAYAVYEYVKEHNPELLDRTQYGPEMVAIYKAIKDQIPADMTGMYLHYEADIIAATAFSYKSIGKGRYTKEFIDKDLIAQCVNTSRDLFSEGTLAVKNNF